MRGFAPVVAAVVFGLAASGVSAAPPGPPWRSPQYSHIADDEPLPTLLREFAADQGVSIVVSEKVQGKVRGRFGPMPPEQYLDTVTRQNGLIWYFDGSAIFVYRGDELESDIFQFRRVKPEAVLEALRDLEVPTDRAVFRISKNGTMVHVIGAPRFVALMRSVATRLEGAAAQKAAVGLSVRVFPLRYAWAEDQTVAFRETNVTVPGVATLLRNLVGLSGRGPQGGGGVRKNPAALPTLAGQGLASVGEYPKRSPFEQFVNKPASKEAEAANQAAGADPQQPPTSVALDTEQGMVPSIQSEPRLNAVVIQDLPDRFPVYEALIASLDVPVGLVEIEAMIIDVSSNKNFSLGLPVTINGKDSTIDLRVSPTDQANLAFTLVNGGAQQLLVQLQALAANGHAKVVARPAVLTLDNMEAQLESTQTIYVRVPGTFANDLFNIVVGTSLRVTPHIVDEGGQRRVKLQVRVQDGVPLNATVDAIPTVQTNSVNTQAVLAEDQSLFIGGLSRDERNLQERGIPWLKDIPRVGMLFRTTISTSQKTERYVLLTPRIVSLDAPSGIGAVAGGLGANGACQPGCDGPANPPPPAVAAPLELKAPPPTDATPNSSNVPWQPAPPPPTPPMPTLAPTTEVPSAIPSPTAPTTKTTIPTAKKSALAPPPQTAANKPKIKMDAPAPVESAWPEAPLALPVVDAGPAVATIPKAKTTQPNDKRPPADNVGADGWRSLGDWSPKTARLPTAERR